MEWLAAAQERAAYGLTKDRENLDVVLLPPRLILLLTQHTGTLHQGQGGLQEVGYGLPG